MCLMYIHENSVILMMIQNRNESLITFYSLLFFYIYPRKWLSCESDTDYFANLELEANEIGSFLRIRISRVNNSLVRITLRNRINRSKILSADLRTIDITQLHYKKES